MKKLAYLPGYWLDIAQIWCREYFWIVNPKSTIKFLYDVDVILTSNACISLPEDAYDIIMTSISVHFFLESHNLSSSYEGLSPRQIWFNLDQGKQSYGERGAYPPPPPSQVENVLNRQVR